MHVTFTYRHILAIDHLGWSVERTAELSQTIGTLPRATAENGHEQQLKKIGPAGRGRKKQPPSRLQLIR